MHDMTGAELHVGDTIRMVISGYFSDLDGLIGKVSDHQNDDPNLIRVCFNDYCSGCFFSDDIVKVSPDDFACSKFESDLEKKENKNNVNRDN